jgi:hypothetical protein
VCDNSTKPSYGGVSYQPYGKTLKWNTLSDTGDAKADIVIPTTGWTTSSNTICPIKAFRITDWTSGVKSEINSCSSLDLRDECRLIKLYKDDFKTNGLKKFTFHITAVAEGGG